MSITLVAVMISWVFAYIQTHQVVHITYVQFLVYQLYLNKAVIKKKKDSLSQKKCKIPRDCFTWL